MLLLLRRISQIHLRIFLQVVLYAVERIKRYLWDYLDIKFFYRIADYKVCDYHK